MERTLQHQWREATPAKSEVTFGGLFRAYVMTMTHQFAVIASELSSSELARVSVVNIRDGTKVKEDSFPKRGMSPEALLSEGVLLLVWYGLVQRGLEVFAWNIFTKEKVFNKKFSAGSCVIDQRSQQVMVGMEVRLEIVEGAVRETSQTPLPVPQYGFLRAFRHPHYLTRAVGGGIDTLWTMKGAEVTGVELRAGEYPLFCPGRENLFSRSSRELRFHSSQSGELLKVQTSPTAVFNMQVSSNQLVGWSRLLDEQDHGERDILVVYQLNTLLTQSAGPDISPRRVAIGQPGFWVHRVYLNNPSVTVLFRDGSGIFKFICFDFWKCQD